VPDEGSDEAVVAPAAAQQWIERFADALGVDAPDAETIEVLLDLAGVAAHASERWAAPIACYLVGRAGAAPADARRTADTI
jgi:hypothetical protein